MAKNAIFRAVFIAFPGHMWYDNTGLYNPLKEDAYVSGMQGKNSERRRKYHH